MTDLAAILERLTIALEKLEAPAAPRKLLDITTMIDRLNVSLDWWRHNHRHLREAHGFPAAVPGFPHRWDPVAVDAWLDALLSSDEPRIARLSPETVTGVHLRREMQDLLSQRGATQ